MTHLAKWCDVSVMNEHRLCAGVLTWKVRHGLTISSSTHPENVVRDCVKIVSFVLFECQYLQAPMSGKPRKRTHNSSIMDNNVRSRVKTGD